MPAWIGLLRAVNLGKNRKVPMQDLRRLLESEGYEQVETHIQSGNVRVRSTLRSAQNVEEALRRTISAGFGFDVPVVVRTPAQLSVLADEAESLESPLSLEARRYVTFMTGELDPAGVQALHDWDVPTEAARVLDGRDIVMFLADGVQGARLTHSRIERLTGAVGTARNLSVVRAMAQKWGG